ncbi:Zinc finger PLAG1 [Lecanosticta acicola]|uniref:Zinc finger PLAG1 n=1 Tax=Lecanosticta acicola TaxID=111012 RepID=A0AAI8Z756_9PEZI|nr:Zinc finger PLAG1 [Lecanosticta acicola]
MGGPSLWSMSMDGGFRMQHVAPNEQVIQSFAPAPQPSSFGQEQSMAAPSFRENWVGNTHQWSQPGNWNNDPTLTANDNPLHAMRAPAMPSPSQHVHADRFPGALQPLTHNWSFAPQLQYASTIYQTTFQLNNQGYQPPLAQASMIPRSYPESSISQEPNAPERLSADVTNNYNYPQSVAHGAVGNMRGWIGRAPTTGDRAVPRLDTNFLAPPEHLSATRSPTSASTTGSSRPGSRRKPWEMTVGDFVCGYCNAGFPAQGDLTHHLRSHAPYTSRQHVCDRCHKRFQYRKDLHRHLPKHDPNRKKFYCPLSACKYHTKGFGRADHLERHLTSQHRIDTPMRASRSRSPANTNLMK